MYVKINKTKHYNKKHKRGGGTKEIQTNLPEEDVYLVDVSAIQSNWMRRLGSNILECEEVIWELGRSDHLAAPMQTEHEKVENQAVVLDDERSELQASDDAVRVGVIHVLQANESI